MPRGPLILLLVLLVLTWSASAHGQGWAAFASGGKVYISSVGGTPKQLYSGSVDHACWSSDALYIYFIKSNGEIWRMYNDGSGPKKIAQGSSTNYCPIAPYRPDPEFVLYVSGSKFYKVSGSTGAMTLIHTGSKSFVGEIAINSAGTRMAARDSASDLHKINVGGSGSIYDTDCSASVSPNGSYLTANVVGHTKLDIYSWSGGIYKTLTAPSGAQWDNQKFAANSNDYVVFRYDNTSAIGINYLPQNVSTKICNLASNYPDFFVGNLPPVSGTGNKAPVLSITSPSDGATFSPGAQMSYAGSGTDPEDGPLAASSLLWTLTKVGSTSPVHSSTGANGSYTFPASINTDTKYTLDLSGKDSKGLGASTSIAVWAKPPQSSKTIVIEAESMTLSGYTDEGNWIATMSTGSATKAFPGATDTYRTKVVIIKEDDGQPTLEVWVANTLIKTINYPLGSSHRDPETVDIGVHAINKGDLIKLVGTLQNSAAARVDKLTFEPEPLSPGDSGTGPGDSGTGPGDDSSVGSTDDSGTGPADDSGTGPPGDGTATGGDAVAGGDSSIPDTRGDDGCSCDLSATHQNPWLALLGLLIVMIMRLAAASTADRGFRPVTRSPRDSPGPR